MDVRQIPLADQSATPYSNPSTYGKITQLVEQRTEKTTWAHGCIRVEVTSGDHRPDAHAFYERMGYKSDCRRFIKTKNPE
jgi:hypothetical protein